MNELMNTNNANTTTIALLEKNTAFVNGTLFTTRDYTVRELMPLIENGTICYEQTTQRDFVYNSFSGNDKEGKLTSAGALIRDLVKENEVDIPGVIFVYNSDTCKINIHDGKQRLLSLYYFCHPEKGEDIGVYIGSRKFTWDTATPEEKEKLMNTLITVTIRKQNTDKEEKNFYAINTHGVPLTNYETLRGSMFGAFLTTFEDHMKDLNSKYKHVEVRSKSSRGESLYKYLIHFFGIHKLGIKNSRALYLELIDHLRPLRNYAFDESSFDCDHILSVYNHLMDSGFKEDKALDLAYYIVKESHLTMDQEIILLNTYRKDKSNKATNDMDDWVISTHQTFINSLFDYSRPEERRHLDPKREVPDAFLDVIAKKYGNTYHCQGILDDGTPCPCEGAKNMQMDHILPWSLGGRTLDINNLQFLCEKCNKKKGNRYGE